MSSADVGQLARAVVALSRVVDELRQLAEWQIVVPDRVTTAELGRRLEQLDEPMTEARRILAPFLAAPADPVTETRA